MTTKIIYIEWVDAHGGSGQFSRRYAEESATDMMCSGGLLLRETEEAFIIAQDTFQHNGEQPQVREYEVIPKVNVVKHMIFEVPEDQEEV